MKIGIYCDDIRPEVGGASTLTKTILDELKTYKDYEIVFLFSGPLFGKYKYVIDGHDGININCRRWVYRKIISSVFKRLGAKVRNPVIDYIAQKEKIDLVWFCVPVYADISVPFIYTVWDLGHRTVPYFPEVSKGNEWCNRERIYSQMIPSANWILIGNNQGKKEIIENYSVSENKIVIAPFPVASFCYGDESKPKIDLPDKYFFYPAQFWAHKNQYVILKAVKYLNDVYNIKTKVFLTGSDKGNKDYISRKIKEMDLQDQIEITGFLSYEELKYMYTHATAMIFASLMGPNNMPPIEATYLRCPVIITDLPGHIEQLGDTALYFNGYDESSLAKQMYKMLVDESVRLKMIERQQPLASAFDDLKYCKPVIDIFEKFKKIRRRWE